MKFRKKYLSPVYLWFYGIVFISVIGKFLGYINREFICFFDYWHYSPNLYCSNLTYIPKYKGLGDLLILVYALAGGIILFGVIPAIKRHKISQKSKKE